MFLAKKQMADGKRTKGEVQGSRPLSSYNFDEALSCEYLIHDEGLRVRRLTTRACAVPSRPSKHGGRDHLNVSRQEQRASPSKKHSRDASLVSSLKIFPVSTAGRKVPPPATAKNAAPLALPLLAVLRQPEGQTDNWDDHFEEGISFLKLRYKVIVQSYIFFRLITLNLLYSALERCPLRRSNRQSTTMMHKRSGRAAPALSPTWRRLRISTARNWADRQGLLGPNY